MKLKIRKRPRYMDHTREKWDWPTHRAFVRKHECIVPGCRSDDIQACHVRKGLPPKDKAGGSQKPPDWWIFPACSQHHREQHDTGEDSFAKKYVIDLKAAAIWARDNSSDTKMREYFKDRRSDTSPESDSHD